MKRVDSYGTRELATGRSFIICHVIVRQVGTLVIKINFEAEPSTYNARLTEGPTTSIVLWNRFTILKHSS